LVEAELGDHGRVLVRPSGTEPLVRVMVEAPTEASAQSAADRLAAAVRAAG
jgi:phosphoglucosamine mutase